MIEPFDLDSDDDSYCSVIVEVTEDNGQYSYEYHLVVEDQEMVSLNELRALKQGLIDALLAMERLVDLFERDR